MKSELRWYDYLSININWFAITTRSQVLAPLIIPFLVAHFVGESVKGSYLGTIRLWTLMVALLVQALSGMISDHYASRWGKRRPFIVLGTTIEIIALGLIGITTTMEGFSGYWVLFGLYIISMAGSNISHGATQGFIPDLVKDENKGVASGVKASLELPIPLIFVAFVVAPMVGEHNYWNALITLGIVLILGTAFTMFAPEKKQEEKPSAIEWQPILRLVAMTALFTVTTLATGWAVKQVIEFAKTSSPTTGSILVSIAGLLGMAVAIVIGVWLSVFASIGKNIKKQKSFTWWIVNRLTFLVASINLAGFLVYYLQEKFPQYQHTETAETASQLTMFVGIFILFTALPGGWLTDKFGHKKIVSLAGILAGLGTFEVLISPALSPMFIGASMIGAGVGLFYAANWALGTVLVPQGKAGQYLGISNLAGAGAGAVGAYIGGPIADGYSYTLIMALYGSMALLSLLALRGIKTE
ncbi:MFS transporter [Chloroflexota bacterium]